ncbi:MAG: SDR family NAD(P)-dependent oxidoreductase [Rubrivivax sp.]|jgi:NAD(P)-dependent dehydrogenase (short-subunit alcohol dehydrogenase family)|nr:SDR family NAD(P)-dependent oxidoreductase [Rubrivivax sp.]
MNARLPLVVLTGASRGLGRAAAEQWLARGVRLLTLSRRPATLDAPPPSTLEQWAIDLADALPAAERLERWLEQVDPASVGSAVLVNNAGALSRLAPLADSEGADLARALRIDLEAPMLLTAAFLRATAGWAVPRKVLLVSSGLGRRAMAGSASYCAAKAGLDHLARAVALEEAAKPGGARIVSLAPGVIDTEMQVQLREADPALFAERSRFAQMKASGALDSPAAAAAKLLAWIDRADFGAEPVADVRQP